ncbi:septum site-determining protein MinC [Methylobacterium gossipiicola]|uniref:Probable septum site-determining protein MinC n=1 Tax=Methylobacterium gossipiicola TaxID=582675 RepID=A0A1I2TFB1_9HYPH|nr:septum site-determining protein MinC [Methylobacterium gossipiicola]SFG61216.1 septum site-determining protein MinC [Methylobacterium gossipiicola]
MALVLAPVPPVSDWLAELDALAKRSPAFFVGRPVILEISGAALDREGLRALVAELSDRSVTVMGIEGAGPGLLGDGLPPPLAGGRPVEEVAAPEEAPEARVSVSQAPAPARSLILDAPVRSGQTVLHLDGDITVMGSVASGAEVIAGGSLHVYGALRGRAIAGAAGNPEARITCRKFEPELIAIDGLYRTADDLGPVQRGLPAQVRLEGDAIKVAALE